MLCDRVYCFHVMIFSIILTILFFMCALEQGGIAASKYNTCATLHHRIGKFTSVDWMVYDTLETSGQQTSGRVIAQ